MRFHNYQMIIDGVRAFNKNDAIDFMKKKKGAFRDRAFFYIIEVEFIDERYLWIACDYDNANKFNSFVVDRNTYEKTPNPRKKSQVEPRQQFFALYDTTRQFLYLSDIGKRAFLSKYIRDILQKEIDIKAIYSSVDEFCNHIKTLKELRFVQVDNLISRESQPFKVAIDILGLDVEELQVKIGLGNVPVSKGHSTLRKLQQTRDQYERIVVVGRDDKGVEQSFDYSSILKHIEVHMGKDEDEHYEANEVKSKLLQELRNSGNV